MSQNTLSTPDQVAKAYNFLNNVKIPACNCNRGVRMCYNVPCIPSVSDAEKLLDAGYASKMMLDWWVGNESKVKAMERLFPNKAKEEIAVVKSKKNPFPNDVPYLVPAIEGMEGKKAPFSRSGKCTLLVDNKCSLHDKGLKPIQGKLACCSIENMYFDENGRQQNIDERIAIFHTWNTKEGLELIERWKNEVNYNADDDDLTEANLPKNKEDLLDGLNEMLGFISGKQYKIDGCPEVTEEEKNYEEKVVMYEKPY